MSTTDEYTPALVQKCEIDADPALRSALRSIAGAGGESCPVVAVEGDSAPRVAGRCYYGTTPSGRTIVQCPNAYGWPTLYHRSTRRVEVGIEWLWRHMPALMDGRL